MYGAGAKNLRSTSQGRLATAAVVWEKLAEQQSYRAASSQLGDLIDLLDAVVIADRAAR
jgi:hypothetical protein